jgi:hypothetical protein
MIAMDMQVERYGADMPLTDPQPCLNDATHGVTAGDCTRHLCSGHVAPTLYVISGNAFVYPLQVQRRCQYRAVLAAADRPDVPAGM